MNNLLKRWLSLTLSFIVGLLAVYLYHVIGGYLTHREQATTTVKIIKPSASVPEIDCRNYFKSPRDIVEQLLSGEVAIRREINWRLALRPDNSTTFYNYERDASYPEQIDIPFIRYINLDQTPDNEVIITFDKAGAQVALILKQNQCGWQLIDRLDTTTDFEATSFDTWLETVSTISPGIHEILVHQAKTEAGQYFGTVVLYKLINNRLSVIAGFDEEVIKHAGAARYRDKQDYKDRAASKYFFINSASTKLPYIEIETNREIVNYYGTVRTERCYSWVTGFWYDRQNQWRFRPFKSIELIEQSTTFLYWNEQQQRFIPAENQPNSFGEYIEAHEGEHECGL